MNKTKKVISAIVACLLIASPVLAVPTSVDTNWNGGGFFGITFTGGNDAHSVLQTSGALISGEYHAVDNGDNPYGYGVDTVSAWTKTHVENGWVGYTFTRDDSYVPMYGTASQVSYTYIDSTGTGDLAWRSTSDYADLVNSNYGWQSNNQMQATGEYYVEHYLANPTSSNGVDIVATGTGSTSITDMCDSTWGSSYTFGKGCGCYTNAKVSTTGSGTFDLYANANNGITTDSGIVLTGVSSLHIGSVFGSGFGFNNFALSGS